MKLEWPFCSHCGTEVESIIHDLRICPFIFAISTNAGKLDMKDFFFTNNISNIKEWINTNLYLEFSKRDNYIEVSAPKLIAM